MLRKIPLMLLLILFLPTLVMGQQIKGRAELTPPSSSHETKGLGWLKPEGFSMTQSYTFSFFSGGGRKELEALYLNTLIYRFSRPLSLKVHLGHLHHSLPFSSAGIPSKGSLLLGTELRYQPYDNLLLIFEYTTAPFGYGDHWRRGWPYAPYWGTRADK